MAVTGLLALIILVSALIVPRRERHGPFYGIERAIGAGEFVPYYQPIVDTMRGLAYRGDGNNGEGGET
jgi:sensor c-di-GMP phosphodiesterase-like protein